MAFPNKKIGLKVRPGEKAFFAPDGDSMGIVTQKKEKFETASLFPSI